MLLIRSIPENSLNPVFYTTKSGYFPQHLEEL